MASNETSNIFLNHRCCSAFLRYPSFFNSQEKIISIKDIGSKIKSKNEYDSFALFNSSNLIFCFDRCLACLIFDSSTFRKFSSDWASIKALSFHSSGGPTINRSSFFVLSFMGGLKTVIFKVISNPHFFRNVFD